MRSIVRAVAGAVPPVKWLAGHYRRRQFEKRLLDEEASCDPRCGLPPCKLRFRVHGALDEESYVGVGQAVAR